ncbi:hypothetical protein HBI31_222750 [Parastagonospora nodorum]|nr:hypothetical protein HBI11_112270 [Parastagonospora nodorum]KAH5462995.1 hypothetical protein HBI31_222750 [Parastagonospora nodorum]KAH5706442.1 hypothetical protein HBI20_218950 [Parastagonospora nodorum]
MPPKSTKTSRGRGGGRAGATTGRSSNSEAAPDATPQSAETAAASELPAALKQDNDDEDSKPPTPAENTPAPTEQTPPANQDGTDTPGRTPVQRLGSLNPSRSSSPAVRRGSLTRGKRGMVKPTFTGRRSKEDREALAKEALEREKARTQEQAKAAERKQRDADRKAKREAERAIRGRGGYSGAMSGPFSLGSSREDRKGNQRPASGFGAGSGSRATRIKDEGDGGEGSSGYRGSGSGGGGGGSSAKRENGGVESSEDEEDAAVPRRDIDYIEISSGEDDAAPKPRPLRSSLPVRIGRKEHQERTFGINTDASSEQSAKILEQAEAKGEPPTAAALKQTANKGKGKAKEDDVATAKKPFKGVWQDSDETNSPVKTEDNSEDENVGNAEQVGIVERPVQEEDRQEPQQEVESKHRGRVRGIVEPVLQTDEDRAEWSRYQSNLSHIRTELGPDANAEADASGDVTMPDAGNAKKPTVRDNNVYLFQIPPLMPELQSTAIKKELAEASDPVPTSAPTAPSKPGVKIKVEEGAAFTDASKAHEATRFASGHVGKVRVRQSGRTTLDWGGTSYELTPGNKASFLQEVVSINVVPESNRVVPEDAGDAVSLGRVKGKFVVVPDWGEMLG